MKSPGVVTFQIEETEKAELEYMADYDDRPLSSLMRKLCDEAREKFRQDNGLRAIPSGKKGSKNAKR